MGSLSTCCRVLDRTQAPVLPKDLDRGNTHLGWISILGFLNLSLEVPIPPWAYERNPDAGLNSSLLDSCEEERPVDLGAYWKVSFMYKMLEESPRAGFYGGK